ncbi:hypothetical protein RND71_005452 [Anisodus tanguticus]|uniref:Uncharacterized protein n=1 Tax=Anisodus tanguticus TaxID=243964 RepID=A0AAE1SRI7_9SOLA|nr:hypothetical protein RND71_005452 [Anisodus tanguticus]
MIMMTARSEGNTSFSSLGEVSQTCFNFYKSEDLVDSSTSNVVSAMMTNVTNAEEQQAVIMKKLKTKERLIKVLQKEKSQRTVKNQISNGNTASSETLLWPQRGTSLKDSESKHSLEPLPDFLVFQKRNKLKLGACNRKGIRDTGEFTAKHTGHFES